MDVRKNGNSEHRATILGVEWHMGCAVHGWQDRETSPLKKIMLLEDWKRLENRLVFTGVFPDRRHPTPSVVPRSTVKIVLISLLSTKLQNSSSATHCKMSDQATIGHKAAPTMCAYLPVQHFGTLHVRLTRKMLLRTEAMQNTSIIDMRPRQSVLGVKRSTVHMLAFCRWRFVRL